MVNKIWILVNSKSWNNLKKMLDIFGSTLMLNWGKEARG